jgi:hypothetical protein|tara:strand:- start:441 stop:677 length:237 start_codon:yes stop_codon:yes gene_type:complete
MNSLYPPLNCPELDPTALKRGLEVQTRIFYADSLPGRKAKVVRFWETPKGWFVRLNYGKNLSGQSLLKTMPCNVLALA